MPPDITQEGNRAGGHIAGGSIREEHHHHYSATTRSNRLAALVARLKAEVEADQNLREFIEDLAYYTGPVDPASRPDLATKLRKAHRDGEITQALKLKEVFWKRLDRNQFSRAAQEIYAYLLGHIHHRFKLRVVPMIQGNASKAEIDAAVTRDVIEAVWQEIDENPLTINIQQIRGMLFYLTGNCWVKWHQE